MDRDLSFRPVDNPAPRTLTPAQIAHYNDAGFITPLDVFRADEVAANRRYLDGLLADLAAYDDGRDSYAINCYQHKLRGLWHLCRSPQILDFVEDIVGPNIVAWATHYFCKLPHDPKAVPWHQDASYWYLTPARTVSVWLAIDDADADNAAMAFLAGSHRAGPLPWRRTARDAVLQQELVDVARFGTPVVNTLKAGQMSLHADMLAHGSGPNASGRRRCGLTILYCDPAAVVPLDASYADKAILCRGEDRTGRWVHLPAPPGEDLSPQAANPIVEAPNEQTAAE